MSEIKHTPGPWNVDAMGNVWAKDTKICDKPTQAEMYREKTVIEQKSNFALIEAAPELLESNKELAEIVRELCAKYNHPLPEGSLERSDKAIAKAEWNL